MLYAPCVKLWFGKFSLEKTKKKFHFENLSSILYNKVKLVLTTMVLIHRETKGYLPKLTESRVALCVVV